MAKRETFEHLDGDLAYRKAMGHIIEVRFDEMMRHLDGTLEGRDPEALHQMRVGSRRLRAAMDVSGQCFPAERFRYYRKTIAAITDVLGGVRDCDVLNEELVAYRNRRPSAERPAINRMLKDLKVERDAARLEMLAFFERLEAERFDVRFRGFIAEHTIG